MPKGDDLPDRKAYLARRHLIQRLLVEEVARLRGQHPDVIDYEMIARMLTSNVGVPVVCFPAPAGPDGKFRFVAYEVPQL